MKKTNKCRKEDNELEILLSIADAAYVIITQKPVISDTLDGLRRVFPKSVNLLDMMKSPPFCAYPKMELVDCLALLEKYGLIKSSVMKMKNGKTVKAYKATMKDK